MELLLGEDVEGGITAFNFILERCLLLAHKRLTIQTTNAIKDVANEGHISPDVMGDPCTKTRKMGSL